MRILNIVFALILAVGLFLPFNYPVQAATTNLLAQGEEGQTQGGYSGGAGNYTNTYAVDGAYLLSTSDGWLYHCFNMQDFTAAYYSISSVSIDLAGAGSNGAGNSWKSYIRIGGVNYYGTTYSSTGFTYSNYADSTFGGVSNANPSTGAAWSSAEINAAEFGFAFYVFPGNYPGYKSYCDKLSVTVTYSIPAAPTAVTSVATSITSTTAVGNGNISDKGIPATITERGICYKAGSSGDPTTADSTSHDHVDVTGAYTEAITGLTKGTAYRLRAYAINATGTGYGTTVAMTTLAPTVTTQAASAIAPTTATGNGNITSNGGEVITEKGICYKAGSSGDPTTADSTVHDHIDSTGAYTEAIAGLTKGTAYRLRAYIISALGTAYGTTVDLVTIDDPTITTQAASLVSSNTARLNSQVTFDGKVGGGEACTVTFVYVAGSPYATYALVKAAGGSVEQAAAGTWTAGQFPNLDVTGLVVGTQYSFAVKIVNSTTTVAYGSVLTFTTSTGISDVTDFKSVPAASTVSLVWTKGLGSQYTLVRYTTSAYPTTIVDGTVAYLGTSNSYMLTGLTPGTSYYFSAWAKAGALYSAGYATTMATTLAYDTAVSTGTLEAPPTNSWWNQTPSTTKVSNIPLISGLVAANSTAYAIPEASLWYFLWVLFSVGLGVFIYNKSGNNLPMSLGAQALLFALGAVLGLVMLWIMVLFMIIGAGFSLWGDRR